MKIVLGVSGGIAAYKAPELVRRLQDIGADVQVVLTPNAARFVSPLSLAAVSHHGVILDQWGDPGTGGVDHIELARRAELLLIAPATANVLAKLAVGIADDALTTYALAHRSGLMVAPAMNWSMLQHPTVVGNLETLRARGVEIIDPESGYLAEGEEGPGRLAEIPVIVERVRAHFATRDLEGKRVLVTAGPTREPIDPVRYLSNRSSGKMGYALAEAARRRGAAVTLVSGPTSLPSPAGVDLVRITTAQEMFDAVTGAAASHHIVIKAAAVADFTPSEPAGAKIKKKPGEEVLNLSLRRNPDILASLDSLSPRPFIVAFAAETDSVEENARLKLEKKRADLIVANDVGDASIGFDSEQNEVLIIGKNGDSLRLEKAPKLVIANRILDAVVQRLHG
ncbi:MAG TPA: bifunctional phosphopantothenoylcysteine decarboxylase/phosphopantothenate--cysteine ligase CoaBC [Thermoanaerobaculia bacterium]|nr:bifunctional phosphopantothenoylcysteine decarboxylase/phosphopantothenate--cysteine ligase CoaBC [Thermoanaerobaculia bacterium]